MAVTPSITKSTPVSGSDYFVPGTVFFDAFSSGLSGSNPSKSEFTWNIGFTSTNSSGLSDCVVHPDNKIAEYTLIDWRKDFQYQSIENKRAWLSKSESLTTQNGYNIAFSFTKPGTYTVGLNIRTEEGWTGFTATSVTVTAQSGWNNETVAFDGTGPTGFTYANLNEAFDAISLRATPKNTLWLTAGKQYSISNPITLDYDLTVLSVTSANYPTNGYLNRAIIVPSATFDVTGNSAMAVVNSSGNKFEHVCFKNTLYNPDTIGLAAVSIAGGEQNTFYNCAFRNLNYGISTDSLFVQNLFVNQCTFNRIRSQSVKLNGRNVVLQGNILFNSNTGSGNQLGSVDGFMVGDPEGGFFGGLNASYNYFLYNGTSGKFQYSGVSYPPTFTENTSHGPIGLTYDIGTEYVHIQGNFLSKGTNSVSGKNISVRYNYFTNAGNRAALEYFSGVSGFDVQNNVFRILNDAPPHAVAICGYGSKTGNSLNASWNTFVVDENIQDNTAIVDLSTPVNSGSITVNNNLFTDNGYFLGKYIKIGTTSGLSGSISQNIIPLRRASIPCFSLSGSDVSWTDSISGPTAVYFSGNTRQSSGYDDMSLVFGFVPNITNGGTSSSRTGLSKDFLGQTRHFSGTANTVGAVQNVNNYPFIANAGLTVSGTFTATSRTNRSDGSIQAGMSGWNGYVSLSAGLTAILQPSLIVGNTGLITDTGATSVDANGNPATVNPCGADLETRLSYASLTNGANVSVLYTAGSGSAIDRTLGRFTLYGINLGGYVRILDTRKGAYFIEKDNRLIGESVETGTTTPSVPYNEINYKPTAIQYSRSKFSPVCVIQNRDYTLGVSIVHDYFSNPRFWQENTQTFLNSNGGSYGMWNISGAWYQNGPNLSNIVATGATHSTTFALRVVGGNRLWWKSLDPWKDYFQTTYGDCVHGKDNRPIKAIQPTQLQFIDSPSEAGAYSPFGFYNSSGTDYDGNTVTVRRADQYGWTTFANDILRSHNQYKYDRVILWSPAGQFNASGTGGYTARDCNYPFLILSPMFTLGAPQRDVVLPAVGTADQLGRLIAYPESLPTGDVTRPMVDTLPLLREASLSIPEFHVYWGRYTQVDRYPWYSGITFDNMDLNNSQIMQRVYNEMDLACGYIQARGLVQEIFGLPGPQYPDIFTPYIEYSKSLDQLNLFQNRYPGLETTTEGHYSDYFCLYMPQYLFVKNADSEEYLNPNPLSHYVVPGNERWGSISQGYIYPRMGISRLSKEQYLQLVENTAAMGYVPVVFDNLSLSGNESTTKAVEKRFEVYPDLVDYPSLITPTIATGGYSKEVINTQFSSFLGDIYKREISISWNENTEPDFSHYEVYRSVGASSGPYKMIACVRHASYDDQVVDDEKQYYYKVEAVDIFGNESGMSTPLYVSTLSNPGGTGATGGAGATDDTGNVGAGPGGGQTPIGSSYSSNSGSGRIYTIDGRLYTEEEYRRRLLEGLRGFV